MKVSVPLMLSIAMTVSQLAWCDDTQDDSKLMDGTWIPVSAEIAGTKLPPESIKDWRLILKGEKYQFKNGIEADEGTVKVDATQKPKTIDITGVEGPNKGKTILTIYELKDETLKVCYDLGGKDRPTEFKTKPASKLFLVTYKREKP